MEVQTVLLVIITVLLFIVVAIFAAVFVGILYLKKKVKYLRLSRLGTAFGLIQLGKLT